jgi:hypothetical protein
MPCRRQPAWCGAGAAVVHPQAKRAPHRALAPWLHVQWRGKEECEEGTTGWCLPRSRPAGECMILRLTVAARCRRTHSWASCLEDAHGVAARGYSIDILHAECKWSSNAAATSPCAVFDHATARRYSHSPPATRSRGSGIIRRATYGGFAPVPPVPGCSHGRVRTQWFRKARSTSRRGLGPSRISRPRYP